MVDWKSLIRSDFRSSIFDFLSSILYPRSSVSVAPITIHNQPSTTHNLRSIMSTFLPLPRGDRWYLIALLIFVFVSFLPWSRDVHIAGMALFGWLMAALMVFSPTIALVRLWREAKRSDK